MSSNCPVDCIHCSRERAEESDELAEARLMRAEDDANFADQDEEHCPPDEDKLTD